MLAAIIYACGVFGHVDFRKTIVSPVISTKEDQFGITVPVMSQPSALRVSIPTVVPQ